MFSLFRYYVPSEKGVALHLKKMPFTYCFELNLAEIFPVVRRKRLLNFCNVFALISENDMTLHLTKLDYLHSRMLCAKLTWNDPMLLEKKIKKTFLNSSMYFQNFIIISPLGKDENLHLNNLNSLYSRIHCA